MSKGNEQQHWMLYAEGAERQPPKYPPNVLLKNSQIFPLLLTF